ncbi:hypothetical protein TcG_03619 [Trypanosoma cruzi]|nr:hypothetical protein TcG_03619 [Trypanosoma cruzi]
MSSSHAWWVAAGVVCLRCVDAVSWCVNCAAGPAASPHVVCSHSLYPRCSVPLPPVAFLFFWLTDQLTAATPLRVMVMMTMVTVRLRVVCAVLVLALSCCCCCTPVCVTAGEEVVASPSPLLPVPRKQTEDGPRNAGKIKANDNEDSSLSSFVS